MGVKTTSFNVPIGIDIVTYKLLDGQFHHVNTVHTIAASTNSVIGIIPSTDTVAIVGEISADAGADFVLWEDATMTALSGTTLTSYNFNRNNSTSITTQFVKAPTWTTGTAIKLATNEINATVRPTIKEPGDFGEGKFWVLNNDYTYFLEVRDNSAASNTVFWNLQVIEY